MILVLVEMAELRARTSAGKQAKLDAPSFTSDNWMYLQIAITKVVTHNHKRRYVRTRLNLGQKHHDNTRESEMAHVLTRPSLTESLGGALMKK